MCGYKTVANMVKNIHDALKITVPVALHLDHGTYDGAKACIEVGFTSVMFDGSHYPIEENVAKTTELVNICNEKGLSLEAEVGSIGGEENHKRNERKIVNHCRTGGTGLFLPFYVCFFKKCKYCS